ncbi:MAG: RES family NAD+ phosphorylase [Candidatus Eremiobacteraeota bacterium]|nr:RES family NAD+ phosphorylase [Candidatus Eremiobacteraeota bacterium]
MRVYRVCIYLPNAAPNEPGGVFFIPPNQAGTRIGNSKHYQTLYVGDSAAGVCAEAFNFGRYRLRWTSEMLRGRPDIPGSYRALAWYDLEDATVLCNLDDPSELLAQSLRPSEIITRDYAQSQAWALRLFQQRKWRGLRWWSYHDARWASVGLWSRDIIKAHGVERLTMSNPALSEAADVLKIELRA